MDGDILAALGINIFTELYHQISIYKDIFFIRRGETRNRWWHNTSGERPFTGKLRAHKAGIYRLRTPVIGGTIS